ncbi:MAG: hypothetical protein R2827_09925 [Bdellovibrionales bacterium]
MTEILKDLIGEHRSPLKAMKLLPMGDIYQLKGSVKTSIDQCARDVRLNLLKVFNVNLMNF